MELTRIIDKQKAASCKFRRHHADKFRHAKNAMRIELDAMRPDRDGQVKRAVTPQDAMKIIESLEMAIRVKMIAVTAQTEVLQCMKTRD